MSMSDALGIITKRVRDRLRTSDHDLSLQPELTDQYVTRELEEYVSRQPIDETEDSIKRKIVANLTGFGPLQDIIDDPDVEEFWINSPEEVFLAKNGKSFAVDIKLTDSQLRDILERMLQGTGRRIDMANPFVDASLPDGSRLHAVIPDITARHISINVRKFMRHPRGLDQLVRTRSLTAESSRFLQYCVKSRANFLVSGATQAGKTTMLNSLLSCCSEDERVVTVEETFELDIPLRDVVSLQCRQATIEGSGEINLRRLVKETLRMRPDRIVVGEVREAESLDLLIALNSGIPGAATIHANSARDALRKMTILPLLSGKNIDSAFIVPTVANCIDIVVHCELGKDGHRRVSEILALSGRVNEGIIEASPVFTTTNNQLQFTGIYPEQWRGFMNEQGSTVFKNLETDA